MTHSSDDDLDNIFAQALSAARNAALDAAVDICDEAHKQGLNASGAALAIREMQKLVNKRLGIITQAITHQAPAKVN